MSLEKEVIWRTGLKLDPYFSASKIRRLLDVIEHKSIPEKRNNLCVSTSDTWLIAQLTGMKRIVTDVATASRTMLLNLKSLSWDSFLLEKFGIPDKILPSLVDNTETTGITDSKWFGSEIPLGGICVDQQAALFGQHCFCEGDTKLTYGTGCFILSNIGSTSEKRSPDLLTSVGWRISGQTSYVFDGGIYTAGAIVEWLINTLNLSNGYSDINELLESSDPASDLFFVPALSGLAAPYWEPDAKGAWYGLTLNHDRKSLVRSAIEAIGFRVKDVFDSMEKEGLSLDKLNVDGGLKTRPPESKSTN